MRWILMMLIVAGIGWAQQVDVWDLPPLRYSEAEASDRIVELKTRLRSDPLLEPGSDDLERLRFVLKWLDVPVSSQVLVFSKTSRQVQQIDPTRPRALYFSEDHYVGHVPGGSIELIVEDPVLGPVFYMISGDDQDSLRIERDVSECFSCHGTSRTEGVPGVFVRSVFPNEEGRALPALGSVTVDHTTPVIDRWGGYYVTGGDSLQHRGDLAFDESGVSRRLELESKVDLSRYPAATSDVVALLVLEHQCAVHNLLTAAKIRYRRAEWLARRVDPEADPDAGQAGLIADSMADKILAALLFRNEADLGDGVEGSREYQEDYAARFPKAADGRSLADFRLYERIFKYRCSCMIYSKAFASLPPRVKSPLLEQLKRSLETGVGPADHLPESERRRIATILGDTYPGWKEGW